MGTKITEHGFEYGSLKYFRGNAHMVEMGTFGDKKDPVGPKAYMEPAGKVKREYLEDRVTKGMSVSINWSETNEGEVMQGTKLKVFGIGAQLAKDYTYSQTKSANLKLLNLYMIDNPIINMLNNDATAARNYLAEEGNDARLVTEIWVLMEGELAEHFDTTQQDGFKVSAPGADFNLIAKGGSHGTQTITISPGTVFAYKNHKVTNWNNGKTKVEKVEADYYGNG
jgi:hypothetical protein